MKHVVALLILCTSLACGRELLPPTGESLATDASRTDATGGGGYTPDASPNTARYRHGIWVYGVTRWVDDEAAVSGFESFVQAQGLGAVYLSTNYDLLEREELPRFIARLHARGAEVEALIGKVEWANADGRPDMLKQISKILAYNASVPEESRYRSVHLDIEPWMNTGEDLSWVVPLTNSFVAASNALASSGVTLTVDLAGSKVAKIDLPQRRAILAAVDKAVLMQYETPIDDALNRTERFLRGLNPEDHGAHVVVALRVVDFGVVSDATRILQDRLGALGTYMGWALYHYDDLQPAR